MVYDGHRHGKGLRYREGRLTIRTVTSICHVESNDGFAVHDSHFGYPSYDFFTYFVTATNFAQAGESSPLQCLAGKIPMFRKVNRFLEFTSLLLLPREPRTFGADDPMLRVLVLPVGLPPQPAKTHILCAWLYRPAYFSCPLTMLRPLQMRCRSPKNSLDEARAAALPGWYLSELSSTSFDQTAADPSRPPVPEQLNSLYRDDQKHSMQQKTTTLRPGFS
jgi:hypothetical protein